MTERLFAKPVIALVVCILCWSCTSTPDDPSPTAVDNATPQAGSFSEQDYVQVLRQETDPDQLVTAARAIADGGISSEVLGILIVHIARDDWVTLTIRGVPEDRRAELREAFIAAFAALGPAVEQVLRTEMHQGSLPHTDLLTALTDADLRPVLDPSASDSHRHRQALLKLVRIIADRSALHDASRAVVRGGLADPDPDLRRSAVAVAAELALAQDPPELDPPADVLALLDDADPVVRLAAVVAGESFPEARVEVVRQFEDRLFDPDANVVGAAVQTLAGFTTSVTTSARVARRIGILYVQEESLDEGRQKSGAENPLNTLVERRQLLTHLPPLRLVRDFFMPEVDPERLAILRQALGQVLREVDADERTAVLGQIYRYLGVYSLRMISYRPPYQREMARGTVLELVGIEKRDTVVNGHALMRATKRLLFENEAAYERQLATHRQRLQELDALVVGLGPLARPLVERAVCCDDFHPYAGRMYREAFDVFHAVRRFGITNLTAVATEIPARVELHALVTRRLPLEFHPELHVALQAAQQQLASEGGR